ncbi:hypothetical protein PF007_g32452, partial [Phytophthora fragariae]
LARNVRVAGRAPGGQQTPRRRVQAQVHAAHPLAAQAAAPVPPHAQQQGRRQPQEAVHFAASSLDEMNGWIAALTKAIAVIDELERVAAAERLNKQTESESATQE